MTTPWDVIVVGAGAAGLLAAARAAERGRRTLLLEKNRKTGVKILMSGGTRCNLTHAVDKWGIIEAFGKPGRFLHSALASLGPADLVQLFEDEGVRTKVESTGKIFPASDKALEVRNALLNRLHRSGAELVTEEPVLDFSRAASGFELVTPHRRLRADNVVITTGGKSYAGCGTTGDGYAWLQQLGHTIVPPRPALAAVTSPDQWVQQLQGVTLTDVLLRVEATDQVKPETLAERRGSFLFTHFGVSGPAVMDVSRAVTARDQLQSVFLVCDFLPEVPREQLASRMNAERNTGGRKLVAAIVSAWLPRRLAENLIQQAGLPADRHVAELSKRELAALVGAVKETRIAVSGTLGFKKAEVTAGGVALDEIDSRTMQSKLVPNLYLAGEILDLDGPIGGYNFQSAFSTGWLAGESV